MAGHHLGYIIKLSLLEVYSIFRHTQISRMSNIKLLIICTVHIYIYIISTCVYIYIYGIHIYIYTPRFWHSSWLNFGSRRPTASGARFQRCSGLGDLLQVEYPTDIWDVWINHLLSGIINKYIYILMLYVYNLNTPAY